MTYIMSCVWLDYMVKYFQCKNCVGSSPKTKKCVASFLVPGDKRSHFLWLLFLCKNAADAQKVSAADLPGRVVSVYICFISSVSAFALFAVFPK